MQQLVNLCAKELEGKLGWVDLISPEETASTPIETAELSLPLRERLAKTEYQGVHGVNDAILQMTVR